MARFVPRRDYHIAVRSTVQAKNEAILTANAIFFISFRSNFFGLYCDLGSTANGAERQTSYGMFQTAPVWPKMPGLRWRDLDDGIGRQTGNCRNFRIIHLLRLLRIDVRQVRLPRRANHDDTSLRRGTRRSTAVRTGTDGGQSVAPDFGIACFRRDHASDHRR